jgi:hypothetical protein
MRDRVQGCTGPPSLRGFPVGVAVCGAFEYVRGRPDLRPGWLQDRIRAWPRPERKRLPQIAIAGIRGGDGQALPVGEPLGERAVRGGEVGDQLAHLAGQFARGGSEFGALR